VWEGTLREKSAEGAYPVKIDRKELIAGQPILGIRDFLRRMGKDRFTSLAAADCFSISDDEAKTVLIALVERKLIEDMGRVSDRNWFQVVQEGRRLAAASGAPRISRAKAESILKGFLERVEEVNRTEELAYIVKVVRVFGSYLGDANELGDIDLAVELEWRDQKRDVVKYCYERAEKSGRQLKTIVDTLGYAETEVRQLLKNRNRYLSFHQPFELEQLGVHSKLLFRNFLILPLR